MNNFRQSYQSIYTTLPALLVILSIYIFVMPETSFALAGNVPDAKTKLKNQDEDFDKNFRQGRDFIDQGEWAKASEKFSELINKYPTNKSTASALYWLAFSYKKQNRFKEADAALDRLLKDFPNSSWSDDAQVMKMEINAPLGRIYGATGQTLYPSIATSKTALGTATLIEGNGEFTAVASSPAQATAAGKLYTTAQRPALDRADEVRIAAFQSLLSAEPKRAIESAGEILKPDSKSTEAFKLEVLRVLRNPRWTASYNTNNASGQTYFYSSGNLDKQYAPLLRETLVKAFEAESNLAIRRGIIYTLAATRDEQSIQYLARLYNSTAEAYFKKAILSSLSSSNGATFQTLSQTTLTPNTIDAERSAQFNLLAEVLRNEKNAELRRLAFNGLRSHAQWSTNPQILEMVSGIYDSETDEQFKISIIQSLAAARQSAATKKLLDLARNEKSEKLKLEAIYALRSSKDPEVIKFLEDLLK